MNWVALVTSVVVSFFLSPFVVHRLGNTRYGVWVVVNSLVSYMGLLDLGLRGAVTRFVSKGHAQADHLSSSRAVSAALQFRLWISAGIVAVSLVLAGFVGKVFRIPPELHASADWVVLLSGCSLALSLASGVFGGVLAALHRFDLLSAVSVIQTLVSACGFVVLLNSGHGIVALALWQLFSAIVASAGLAFLCFRTYPELRILLKRPEGGMLRELFGYSTYAFIINIAIQIVYYTDNLVIGVFVSVGSVTLYAIGGSIVEYLRNLVSSLTSTFTPLASTLEAHNQPQNLRRLLVHGTRAALFIALPIEVALMFRGHTFIGLWMGEQYAHTSGRVLQILLLGQFFAIANSTSGGIALGLARHRPVAFWAVGEAVANAILSIFLVRKMGIEGVAWGTVLPSLATHLLFWPRYASTLVGIPVKQYIWQSWLRPALAVVPFGFACYFMDKLWTATSLVQFFLQIGVIIPVFLASAAICFWKEVSWRLRNRAIFSSGF